MSMQVIFSFLVIQGTVNILYDFIRRTAILCSPYKEVLSVSFGWLAQSFCYQVNSTDPTVFQWHKGLKRDIPSCVRGMPVE